MRRRNFVRRGAPRRANLQWSDVSGQWSHTGITATAAAVLVQLQSPASLAALTADPPEDLTVLRVVGDFVLSFSNVAGGSWTLALIVADVTWTPATAVSTDNDKRILWQMSYYGASTAVVSSYEPPGMYFEGTGQKFECPREAVHIDISPKVKIEAGKALYLVAYENIPGPALTTSSTSMRLLYKRSGRR